MSCHVQPLGVENLKAASDLSSHRFVLVKKNSSRKIELCGNAEKPYGVMHLSQYDLGRAGPLADEEAEVTTMGGAEVKINDTVAAGTSIASGANGIGRPAVAGEWAIGVADEAGVSGDVIPVRIFIHQLAQEA